MIDSNNIICNVPVDLPYPPVKTNSRNPDYAAAMLSNVGSCNSEMTAISLYFYNSVILEPEYENIAHCFSEIGIVEMHHLDIFATLAFQMGLDPRLWSIDRQRRNYWTPSCNCYPRKPRAVIENAIKGEREAIQKYSRQANNIYDKNIVEILKRIILDEERHIEIFNSMLDRID